uniref:Uncharacterized protein n=1 Tax=Caenorhabditis japonica TaxID=281687 RepID=A0A8R1I0Y8_CAEJA
MIATMIQFTNIINGRAQPPHQRAETKATIPLITRDAPFHFERIRVDPEEKGGGVSVEPFPGPSLLPGTLIRPSLGVSLRSTPHPRTLVRLSPCVSTRSPLTSTHTRTACRLAPPRRPCTLARRTVGPFRMTRLPLIHQSLI